MKPQEYKTGKEQVMEIMRRYANEEYWAFVLSLMSETDALNFVFAVPEYLRRSDICKSKSAAFRMDWYKLMGYPTKGHFFDAKGVAYMKSPGKYPYWNVSKARLVMNKEDEKFQSGDNRLVVILIVLGCIILTPIIGAVYVAAIVVLLGVPVLLYLFGFTTDEQFDKQTRKLFKMAEENRRRGL